jgi:NAD(P)-dependent dehydrogenase (short-subunit alcohol dehydrogenase family)
MDLGLTGRRVLITGGSKGIGLACARAFADAGCDVTLAARDAAALEAAVAALRLGHRGRFAGFAADLSRDEERARLVAGAGEVDILVNNAGAIPGGRLHDIAMPRWREAWELKVMGTIHLTQLLLPAMEARGSGIICNIIGMAGRAPRMGYICGATGNAALIAFTSAVGGDSTARGVRVFGINPAATATQRMETLARRTAEQKLGDAERWRETLTGLPFGRPIEPEEVGELCAFLCSARAPYVSGTVVDLDGGAKFRA